MNTRTPESTVITAAFIKDTSPDTTHLLYSYTSTLDPLALWPFGLLAWPWPAQA